MPTRFTAYAKPIEQGGFDIKLAKKPQGSLTQSKVELAATKLRTAIDNPSFMRTERWGEFRDDADQLHTILLAKVKAMKADATSAAERREANESKSAELTPDLVKPNLTGTPAQYATVEALLRHMSDYSVLVLPEEKILELHPLSDKAKVGSDLEQSKRVHVHRWRKGMVFESFAVQTLAATWGSQRKLSFFVWRVPLDATAREQPDALAAHLAAIRSVERQLPEIHGRYARQQFAQQYSQITGLSKGMLYNMRALLTSDGSAPHDSGTAECELRVVEFIASRGNVELWPDMRALNGNDGSKYDLFWDEGDRYLAELKTLASGNRHGQQRSLQQPLSVPDFTRQVEQRLCAAGQTDAPIPCADWVAFQFHPHRPTDDVASRFTGRWAIKLQVLQITI
eukprot:7376731-Prymnesium_polylepis.1